MNDRERLGGRRAAVIGGSMAGLLAARVLSDHFDEVTIVERDRLPEIAAERKGSPQGRHAHALLAKGLEILADFFPGMLDDLAQGGAERLDFGTDFHWHHYGTWKARFPSGIRCSFQSRALVEAIVRRRVLALPNVRLRDACDARGLIAGRGGRDVAGVRIQPRGGEVEELHADLVADASGRGSRTPAWLEELGYARPEESAVKVHVGYASRIYRRPDPSPHPWKALYVLGTPPLGRRFGGIFPIEGGRWIVTLGGLLKDYPPGDEEGFLEFARRLSSDELHRAIRSAEPLTDIATYRFPAHLRRRYERLSRSPEGLVVLGDALCSFNPIYGQGMTTSALAAVALDGCLRGQRRSCGPGALEGFAAAFQRRAAEVIDVPWVLATGEDLRFPEVEGLRSATLPLLSWYVGEVHALCGSDAEVTARFYKVQQMLARPATLLHPRVAFAVLRRRLSRRAA